MKKSPKVGYSFPQHFYLLGLLPFQTAYCVDFSVLGVDNGQGVSS